MKKRVSAVILVLILTVMVHAERPPQYRKDAKLAVSATVKKITTKEEAFGGDGVLSCYTAELQVDTVEKGDAVKAGDKISVTWFNATKRPSKPFAGAYGHAYGIAEKDKAKFWLMHRGPQDPPSVWVIIYHKDGVERLQQPPSPPKQGGRQNVAGMDENHPVLMSYRKAVEAMKKLPATYPLSWQFQANMHGALKNDGANDAWRWCMHGNWYFLPWHRGYIYYFEKIVRKMSGDDGFRLPYWAWETEGQNSLPAPFRQQQYNGMGNVFFDDTRVKAANTGMPLRPDQFGSFATDWQNVRGVSQFTTSQAELSYGGLRVDKTMIPMRPASLDHGGMESQAHDLIHVAVGDDTGNMGHPDTAARDPIFWLHHATVDRLWNRWRDIAGHVNPDPVADKDWYDQEFPFYDANGKQVVVSVSKILELAESESRYDDDRRFLIAAQPPKEKSMPKMLAIGAAKPNLILTTKPLISELQLTEGTEPKLTAALTAPPTTAMPPAVLLRIEGIKSSKDARMTFEVFLMKKGDGPSKKSYVGAISFFGRRGDHGHDDKGFTQGFDVTRMVHAIQIANKSKLPDLAVAIVPHSTNGLSAADLAKQNIQIPVANITLTLVTVEKKDQ